MALYTLNFLIADTQHTPFQAINHRHWRKRSRPIVPTCRLLAQISWDPVMIYMALSRSVDVALEGWRYLLQIHLIRLSNPLQRQSRDHMEAIKTCMLHFPQSAYMRVHRPSLNPNDRNLSLFVHAFPSQCRHFDVLSSKCHIRLHL